MLLSLDNVSVQYQKVAALKGISMGVPEGGIVTIIGANGAGKSTTLRAVSGLVPLSDGQIWFAGQRIDRKDPPQIVKQGIAQVFEGRRIFEHLTIRENLIAGAHLNGSKSVINQDIDRVLNYFPILGQRMKVSAGYLSGGEQQMLAIGRGLMSRPKLLLLDEPSLGLAPLLVIQIYSILRRLNEEAGLTMLIVEQNAAMALSLAHEGYVMENGKIVLKGSAEELRNNDDIKEFYLGLSEMGARKSYRDVKHYRRRKRWLA